MKSFLLLLLSLMTDCEASSKEKKCETEWKEYSWTCRDGACVSESDVIQHPEPNNLSENSCNICLEQTSSSEEDKGENCQSTFVQTAYRTAETTIKCDYSETRYKVCAKFLCKEKNATYEDILYASKSDGRFSLTETSRGFNVSISNVSSHDAGVYWCGVETEGEHHQAALRKIELKVEDITNFTRSATTGQNFTYWCKYPNGSPIKKFICKGEDPSICETLVSTVTKCKTRFCMREDKLKTNITITVRDVTADDAGTYWCGAQSTDGKHSNPFYHRFTMTVETLSSPSFLDRNGGLQFSVIIAAAVSGAVLLLSLMLILLCKRFKLSKNTRNDESQNNKEDGAYEEIQEHQQKKPYSGTALKTIYVTADLPSEPSSASHHYSNITFQNNSRHVRDDSYYTVRGKDQSPAYSTANHPTRFSEDPFYSTVNNVGEATLKAQL